MDRPYVSLSNLETFWTAAKQYIDNMSGGSSPELLQTVQDLVTNLNNEITTREEADIEINRLINAINEYTINGNKVSLSPTLNGDDIPYSSDTDEVSVYDKVNSIDQKVEAIDGYTVCDKKISTNPVLTGNDITLGVSVGDDTNYPTTKTVTSSIQTLRETIAGLGHVMELKGVLDELPTNTTNYENGDVVIVGNKEYLCYNSSWHLLGDVTELSQDVSTIKSSYVKSITCTGSNGVTVTPTTASNGDVTITVDALTLNQKFAEYLPLSGGTINGNLGVNGYVNAADSVRISSGSDSKIRLDNTDTETKYQQIVFLQNGTEYGRLGTYGNDNISWNSNPILHTGNYSNYALPLSGGTITSTANIPLKINTSYNANGASNSWIGAITCFNGSLAANQHFTIDIGKSATPKNSGWLGFYYVADGSNNNRLSLGLNSMDDVINIFGSGNVSIGNTQNTTASEKLHVHGNVKASNFITTSDRRAKKNITEITDASKSLELNFYEFDYKDNDNHSAGHVAQEVKEVLPKFVHGNESETEYLSIDYTGLHSMQIKALKNEINLLKKENKELRKSEIELNTRIEKLERLIEKLI